MVTPDPRREHDPTMDGDDDLQAGHYDADGPDQATDDVFPKGDSTKPQPSDEQPPKTSDE